MADLIVFSVGSNKYALDIENIQRIIQASELTNIPNAHPLIDGMLSHEEKVIKVLNFRKLINIQSYDEELRALFSKLKDAHQEWIDSLKHAVENNASFTKTTDAHKCELGIWLDSFNSYDDRVSAILKDLMSNHKTLHESGGDVLAIAKNNKEKALDILNTQIYDNFTNTMGDIDTFIAELDKVANSLQKLIIYENSGKVFAIKVDKIEDIAHIEEGQIIQSNDEDNLSEFLELNGVLELDHILINVIKSIKIPR
jgi:chemotaxis signal transduction protein